MRGRHNFSAQALQVAVRLWLYVAARGCLHRSKASPALGAANWESLLPVHTAPSFIFHANDGRKTMSMCPRLECCLCDFLGIGVKLIPVFPVMVLRFGTAGGDPSTQREHICAVGQPSASTSNAACAKGLCENIYFFPLILSLGLCALL